MTFALVTLNFYCLHHHRVVRYTGVAVGCLVFLFIVTAAPITGTSINPARALGPSLVAGDTADQWAYLLAPIVGSLAAVVAHRLPTWLRRPRFYKLNHKHRAPCPAA